MTDSKSSASFSLHGSTLVAAIRAEQLRDLSVVQQLKEEIISEIKSSAARNVVLDCGQLEFIASVAFLAFLGIRRQGGVKRVILCNLDDNIREVFAICKLIPTLNHANTPFEEAESVQQALELCHE